jgi:hypothetical protein
VAGELARVTSGRQAGIDTSRIGRGPVEADTRGTLEALGAPVHTVLVGEKQLRDLSVATASSADTQDHGVLGWVLLLGLVGVGGAASVLLVRENRSSERDA